MIERPPHRPAFLNDPPPPPAPTPLPHHVRARIAAPIPMTYIVPDELTSPKFGRAFAQGCHGPTTTDLSRLVDDQPFAGFCTPPTWPLLEQCIADNRDYYYGDHGWFKRGKYYRVAKNAVQWQPDAAALQRARPHRFDLLGLTPAPDWNRNGTAIVICPNSVQYMRRFGIDGRQWTVDLVSRLSRITQRPIVIRWKSAASRRPLYVDLHDAWCVVVYSSGAAVEALMAGVPIITLADWATTTSMGLCGLDGPDGLERIDTPFYPDIAQRNRFLWALAERQFTLPELAAGIAWKTVNEG